jgi:hypothetical protein
MKTNSLAHIHASILKLRLHTLRVALACQKLTERQKAENNLEQSLAEREELPYGQGTVDAKDYVKGWLEQFDAYRKQPHSSPDQTRSAAYKRGWADGAAAIERGKQTTVPLWQPTPFLWEWFFQ